MQSNEAALAKADGGVRSGGAAGAAHCDADQPDAPPRKPRMKRPSARCARRKPRSRGARRKSRAPGSISSYATHPRADRRRGRRGAGQRRRAGGAERRPIWRRSSSSIRSMPTSPSRSANSISSPRVRERRPRPHRARCGKGSPGARRRRDLSGARQTAVLGAKVDAHTGQVTLRGEFPNPKRELLPGMYVRVLIEQGIDTDAIARAAAGDPAQRRRRQRSVRGQGRQPRRDAGRAHRIDPGRPVVRDRRTEGRRQGRGRGISEICRRRQGQAAGVDRSGRGGRYGGGKSDQARAR